MAKTNPTENLSNNNLLIIMLLVSLLVVGISALVGKALITSIVRDTKVISAQSKADKQLDQNLSAAPLLVSAYESMGEEKTVLANALPNTADFPGLIVLMETIATDAGVRLKSVAPTLAAASIDTTETTTETTGTASADPAAPQTYAFTVSFDGTYDSARKLLSNLEISARPMRVVGLQLNGSGSAISGELNLETYYQAKATLPFSKEAIK